MTNIHMNADQADALQEVANIGMGRAGAALAHVLGAFVTLSIPRVQVIRATEVEQAVMVLLGAGAHSVTAVRQSFRCDAMGEAIVLYGPTGCSGLRDLMGYEDDHEAASSAGARELLLDVANILIGACLGSI